MSPGLADGAALRKSSGPLGSGWPDRADRMNPVFLKEMRQVRKGRAFPLIVAIMAGLGLLLALGSFAGPRGSTTTMFWFLVLDVVALGLVPIGAYLHLANELDERTIELIALTDLSPLRILLGKIQAAFATAGLYLAPVVPWLVVPFFLARAGPFSVLFALALLPLGLVTLVSFALLVAAATSGRGSRAGGLTVVGLVVLVVGLYILGLQGSAVSAYAWHRLLDRLFTLEGFINVLGGLFVPLSMAALFVACAVARLSFESANTSTPVRAALAVQWLGFTAWALGTITYESRSEAREAVMVYAVGVFLMGYVVGLFTASEPETLSRRVYDSFPRTTVWQRFVASVFYPGGSRGMRFVLLVQTLTMIVALTLLLGPDLIWGSHDSISSLSRSKMGRAGGVLGAYCYSIILLGLPLAVFRMTPALARVSTSVLRRSILGFAGGVTVLSSVVLACWNADSGSSAALDLVRLADPPVQIYTWLVRPSRTDPDLLKTHVGILVLLAIGVILMNAKYMARGLKPVVDLRQSGGETGLAGALRWRPERR